MGGVAARPAAVPAGAVIHDNRELSWLDFNDRVLDLAHDEHVPLLERLRFLGIWANNLDEFFMVRVAGLHDQVEAGVLTGGADGLAPGAALAAIGRRVRAAYARAQGCFADELAPRLAEGDVRIVPLEQCAEAERAELERRFHSEIFPVLTPLAVGPSRPFPYISGLSLSLGLRVRDPLSGETTFARVKAPTEMLPRFLRAGDSSTFVPLESVIAANLAELFPGMEIVEHAPFRVTRDADFTVSDEADDLLQAVQDELRERRFGEVCRIELAAGAGAALRADLAEGLDVKGLGPRADEVYEIDGLVDLADLRELADQIDPRKLSAAGPAAAYRDPWAPVSPPGMRRGDGDPADLFALIRERDVLVHHPYDSFAASVEAFVDQAQRDPDVLAIKQTVYRTSDDSSLVSALIDAAEAGKQAVCLIELKARFDEQANIEWTRAMENAGVHVVHGLPALKTHAKAILVVRRERGGVRRYAHIGTGNYHASTARVYEDFGLFTADPQITSEVAEMFNFLTGFARPQRFSKVVTAPTYMREHVLSEIAETVAAKRRGEHARIVMKMNALVDAACVEALYEASIAGVQVDLVVRGICCLRPRVPGLSENIRVVSIVGRFLEHSRVLLFERGDERRCFIGSADLMPRNLDHRIELMTPIERVEVQATIIDTLRRCLADNVNAWELGADGHWERTTPGDAEPRDVHRELIELALARAADALASASKPRDRRDRGGRPRRFGLRGRRDGRGRG